MKLSPNPDFVLVNCQTWYLLREWYKGGPEIRIFVVGGSDQIPDLQPVRVNLKRRDPKTEREISTGILISLYATDVQVLKFVADLIGTCADSITLKLKPSPESSAITIYINHKTMNQYGLAEDSTIFIAEKTISSIAKMETEEAKNSPFPTNGWDTEEEMLRKAIEESLKDLAAPAGETVNPIPIMEVGTQPREEENKNVQKMKTPSTGESTPAWKLKRQRAREALPLSSHYSHLAKIVEM